MDDETKEPESVEPVYDFSDWGCETEPFEQAVVEEIRKSLLVEFDTIEGAINEVIRSNLRNAFELFAKGHWDCAISQGDENGSALEWSSDAYDCGDWEQPAWIIMTPLQLAAGLMKAARSVDPQDMLDIGLPLWRQALDHVETELRRMVAEPPEEED